MIIKPRWRRPGGLAAHLANTEQNERVEFSRELSRATTNDLNLELRELVALGNAYPRIERSLIHVVISPHHPTDDRGLGKVLELIERMLGIPKDTPRVVVKHTKGARAVHAHAVFLAIDLTSGLGIRSQDSFARAEAAARAAEHMMGEPLTSGAHNRRAAEILHEHGLEDVADRVEALQPPRPGVRLNQKTREILARENVDADELASDLWAALLAFEDAGETNFKGHLATHGITVSQGQKALLATRCGTNASVPLLRTLNTIAKARGRSQRLSKDELAKMLVRGDGPGIEPQLNAKGRVEKARNALKSEYTKLAIEATVDGAHALAASVLEHHVRVVGRDEFIRRLRREREKIRVYERKIALVRRMRVRRAFEAARWWRAHPRLRRLVFLAAASAVTLAGGGLGLAALAGGVALAAIPTYERARTIARAEQRAELLGRAQARKAQSDAYAMLRAEFRSKARLERVSAPPVSPRKSATARLAPVGPPRVWKKRLHRPHLPSPFQPLAVASGNDVRLAKSPHDIERN
jgi:hypothetical protein